ncbi:Os03g0396100 [Oryza sativa Japonica Group]|uniref:Os03g0396100 protein n=1 Tax=Oryza sativa subsp. japonica TaxID=39947 RepID=A0A0P0VZ76_ORYSJ|nr:hypothetical protein EE612_017889 [Oryza sativa]BAS84566.1 Os03g0396100 [Oryza sativa Japonica Group]
MTAFQGPVLLLGVCSNKSIASSNFPHLAYKSITQVPTYTSRFNPVLIESACIRVPCCKAPRCEYAGKTLTKVP